MLSSRTLPLIRYEMTDRVRLSSRSCPCGRPFPLMETVDGRTDDMLELPGRDGGTVGVHPVVFHRELDLLDATGWQVRQREGQLDIQVAGAGPGFDPTGTEQALHAALAAANVAPLLLRVSVVDTILAGAAGKRPLILALQPSTRPAPPHIDDPAGPPGGSAEVSGGVVADPDSQASRLPSRSQGPRRRSARCAIKGRWQRSGGDLGP